MRMLILHVRPHSPCSSCTSGFTVPPCFLLGQDASHHHAECIDRLCILSGSMPPFPHRLTWATAAAPRPRPLCFFSFVIAACRSSCRDFLLPALQSRARACIDGVARDFFPQALVMPGSSTTILGPARTVEVLVPRTDETMKEVGCASCGSRTYAPFARGRACRVLCTPCAAAPPLLHLPSVITHVPCPSPASPLCHLPSVISPLSSPMCAVPLLHLLRV